MESWLAPPPLTYEVCSSRVTHLFPEGSTWLCCGCCHLFWKRIINDFFYLTLNVSFLHPSVVYPRTNTLLEKVAAAVEQSAFYSALWGSLLTSPAVRLPGITYVLAHLNRKLSMEDQLYIIGSDIELMVGCHVTGVSLEPGITDCSEDHAIGNILVFMELNIFHQRKLTAKILNICWCFKRLIFHVRDITYAFYPSKFMIFIIPILLTNKSLLP